MAEFDIQGALKAGYSKGDIADYLAGKSGFDIDGARKSGYSNLDILNHLLPAPTEAPVSPEEKPSGLLGGLANAAWEGTKSMGRSVRAAGDMVIGNNSDVESLAKTENKQSVEQKAFQQGYADRNAAEQDPNLLDYIGNFAASAWENPTGAIHATAEQVANAVPTLGAGAAGAVAGAAVSGPLAPVGAVIGGFLGMALGNTAIEAGAKGLDAARDGTLTDAESSQALQHGAVKGPVIAGIDMLTLGLGGAAMKVIGKTAVKAGAMAEAKVLMDAGVNVADKAAIEAAMKNISLAKAAQAAGEVAARDAVTFGAKAAKAGTGMGLETVGEGVGEYAGEYAATGKGDMADAVMESFMGAGQSSIETAHNYNKSAAPVTIADIASAGTTDEAVAYFNAATGLINAEGDRQASALDSVTGELNKATSEFNQYDNRGTDFVASPDGEMASPPENIAARDAYLSSNAQPADALNQSVMEKLRGWSDEQLTQAADWANQTDFAEVNEFRAVLNERGIPIPKAIPSEGVHIEGIDAAISDGASQITVYENGKKVPFKNFVLTIEGNTATVWNVEREAGAPKGSGLRAYISLGQQLAARGITLESSQTQLKDGRGLWVRLKDAGYAQRNSKTGKGYEFVVPSNVEATQTQLDTEQAQQELLPTQAQPIGPRLDGQQSLTQQTLAQQENKPQVTAKIAGQNSDLMSNEQLQTLVADPATHTQTRRAATEVLNSRMSESRASDDLASLESQRGMSSTTEGTTNGTEANQAQQAPLSGVPQAPQATLPASTGNTQHINSLPLLSSKVLTRSKAKAMQAIGRLTGTEIKFFHDKGKSDGFYRSGNVVYVNTAKPHTALRRVFGHEVTHQLKTNHPEAWQAVKTVVEASLKADTLHQMFGDYFQSKGDIMAKFQQAKNAGKIEEFLNQTGKDIGYNDRPEKVRDILMDEMVSDLGGNRFGEEKFWNQVFDHIVRAEGSEKGKTIIQKVMAAMEKLISTINSLMKENNFKADDFFSEEQINSIRKSMAGAYAEMVQANRGKMGERELDASFESNRTLEEAQTEAGGVGKESSVKTEATQSKENVDGVIIGARPGEFDWTYASNTTLYEKAKEGKASGPLSKGDMPPPIQHPTQLGVRLDRLGPAVEKILNSKDFKALVADVFHVTKLKIHPTLGQYKGKPEPSFSLYGEGMTFEAADGISRMIGFSFAQESTIVTQPVHAGDEDSWPAFYISNGKKLTEQEIASVQKLAQEMGMDYSTSVDGTAFKFFFDGSDLDTYQGNVHKIADAAKLKHVDRVGTRSQFNEAANYLGSSDEGAGRQAWYSEGGAGSSSLFGRTVDHLLIPYAKAVGAEGYRFSPDLFAERFGLSNEQREYIRAALRPKDGYARSTAHVVSEQELNGRALGKGEELLSPTKSDLRAKQPRSNNTDVFWALQNRAAESGLIEPGDYSPEAEKTIAQAIEDEIDFHISREDGKSAVGWYDAALAKAKAIYHTVFPELETNPDREMLFDALLGIASQGNDVHANSVFAGRMYYLITRENMTISEASKALSGTFGKEFNAIENNFAKLEELLKANGYDRMRDLLNKKMTVGEWNAELRKDKSLYYAKKPLQMDGAARQIVTGWMVFGPKIGSFINNLHGDYSTLTADLWFSRTWGRILGFSFLHTPMQEAPKYQAFKDALIAEHTKTTEPRKVDKNGKRKEWDHGKDVSYSDAEIDALLADPEAMLSVAAEMEDRFRRGTPFSGIASSKQRGYSIKSDLRRAAKNWIEHREDAVAAPRNDNERAFQQDVMEAAQKLIKEKSGIDITIADMQAALWYHEKELFGKFGAGDAKAEPADYEDAAKKFMAKYNDGDLFYVEKPTPRYIRGEKGSYKTDLQDTGPLFSESRDDLDFTDDNTNTLAGMWERIAQNENLFAYKTTDKKPMMDVLGTLVAHMKAKEVTDMYSPPNGQRIYRINVPGIDAKTGKSGNADAFITVSPSQAKVWVDVSQVGEGNGGSQIYNAVSNWAYNNHYVFIGDPADISVAGMKRRLENMVSSALKFKTMRHIAGNPKMANFIDQETGKTFDDKSLTGLLQASYDMVVADFPKIKGIIWNPETKRFENSKNGQHITDEQFKAIAGSLRKGIDPVRTSGAPGYRTLQRAAISNTLIRGQADGHRLSAEYGSAQHVASRRDEPGNLGDLKPLYSEAREFWDGIEEGKNDWTSDDIEKAFALGRRGGIRSGRVIAGAGEKTLTSPRASKAVAIWDDVRLGFDGYESSATWAPFGSDQEAFVVSFTPPSEVFGQIDHNNIRDLGRKSIVQYIFTEMKDGRYDLSINHPEEGSQIYQELSDRGRIEDLDGGYTRAKLDDRYATSRALIQEAIRRLALASGVVPTVIQTSRATGARAGSEEVREYLPELVKGKFSEFRAVDTESAEFKRWYGESNLVNEDGSPMRLYHGTNKDFAAFIASKTGVTGKGVYLGDSPEVANSYDGDGKGGANVMPVYARGRYIGITAWSKYVQDNGTWEKARVAAEADGVAGIWDQKFENAVNVFDPKSIKSAISNTGEFSDSNPDIRYAEIRGTANQFDERKAIVPEIEPWLSNKSLLDLAYLDGKPIRLQLGRHPKFGLMHLLGNANEDGRRAPDATTEDDAENSVREVLQILARPDLRLHRDNEMVLRSFYLKKAIVLSESDDLWSIKTIRPAQDNKWGESERLNGGRLTFPTTEATGSSAPEMGQTEVDSQIQSPIGRGVSSNKLDITAFKKGSQVLVRTKQRKTLRPKESLPRNTQGQPINESWAADNLGLDHWDYVKRALLDKMLDTKKVLAEVRKAGVAIKDSFDVYLQETLFHGRAANRVKEFNESELKPLLAEMHAKGVEMEELEDYLWAMHAGERNAQIASINKNMPDGGSGLTNSQAASILSGQSVVVGKGKDQRTIQIKSNKMAAYQTLAQKVKAINDKTLQALVDGDLETQETVDTWKRTYANYVPLMRDMESDDNYAGAFNLGLGTGQGFSIKGSSSKRAMGSERGVIDILANVAMQRERAITRAEKNRVSQAMYGLALTAPNPSFWIPINPEAKDPKYQAQLQQELIDMGVNPIDAKNIAQEPKQQYTDPNTGLVMERVNPQLRTRSDVLAIRVNGKDRFVMFSSDERAQQMVRNLKNLDAEQLGIVMQKVAVVTRYFSSINTQYNPIFGITNFARDSSTALLNLSSTPLAGKQAEVLKHVLPALRGIYIDLRDHRQGKAPASAYAQEFEEFAKMGGQTGYRDMFQTSKARTEAIARELKKAGKGEAAWKVFSEDHPVGGWLSDYNTSIENAWRLSAYMVAKQNGMSKEQAAMLAKELTVNFNRKGLAATQLGALYAFFNASAQGSARLMQTMVKDGKITPAGKKIALGGLTLGVMQAMMGALAGWDDEEPPQHVREKNLLIPMPDGHYISIPLPQGFLVIPNVGRVATEFAMSGFKKPADRIIGLTSLLFDSFNPVGSGTAAQTLAPTIADPVVALSENKDFNNRPIFREDFNKMKPTPGWTRANNTATDLAKGMAYGINYVTGGGKYQTGTLSPTPDQIDYLIGQATGGLGREGSKLWQAGKAPITGEDLPLYKIPVIGRFYGETTGQASDMSRFYSNIKRIGAHDAVLDEMKDAKDGDARIEYLKEHPDARQAHAADTASRELGYLKRQKRAAMDDGNKEKVQQLEQKITTKVKLWNQRLSEKE